MKIVIVIALVAVVTALFTALVFLYRDRGKGERVVAALAVRVVLSAALIGFLVLAYHLGWITPTGAR
ncbi:MAG TPA: twin transmembrane helix small protein [Casimicrobiaceae bacterium]|nr:twin transmembrane helix small protein [Casimicrobiaceae bacterium]